MTLAPPTPVRPTAALTTLPEWNALKAHADEMRAVHLRSLFAADAARGERYVSEAAGLYIDYSKHRITDETLARLFALGRGFRNAPSFLPEVRHRHAWPWLYTGNGRRLCVGPRCRAR